MEKLKVLELFGGIGACSKAIERLGIDYEIADYVEIDKYAVKSFNAIHNTNFEPQDICKWNKDIDVDLIMHGSPCQDFSVAGLGKGGDEGSGTRSSLMYETVRIVEKLKPKYVIWENVKNVISKKHKHNFDIYIYRMEQLGYNNYYQVLNAKDYGIPQNRERVFTISIRKDIDNGYVFPPKKELKLRLKDMLEDKVDEKYYLSSKSIEGRLNTSFQQYKLEDNIINNKDIHPTILARFEGAPTLVKEDVVGTYQYSKSDKFMQGKDRLSLGKDLSDTIQTSPKEGIVTIGNYSPSNHNASRIVDNEGLAPTVMENHGTITATNVGNFRIRRLTPCECWSLMGFDKSDFEKAEKVNSNTQLYKQAGNSIVVNVLEAILKNLLSDYLKPTPTLNDLLKGL